ncbi:TPA: hypothetical protein LLS67_002206 [Serratia marcescens]|nr:hypothetical protein [Serratia marcescens]
MMDKLSELSKPEMYVVRTLDGSVASVKSHSYTAPKGFTSEPLYSQEYVSALLAELEAKDERIGELEVIATEYAGKFQKAQDANKHLIIMSNDDKKRIAELEAKLAAPVRLLGEMLPHEWESAERQAAFEHRKIAWDARLAEDKKAILAAGFTFTVEGDE